MRIPFLGAVELALEKVGIRSYMHPQTFRYSYGVRVQNLSETKQHCTVILPCPKEGGGQMWIEPLRFEPRGLVKTESTYQNSYVVWDMELMPRAENEMYQEGVLRIQPTQIIDRKGGLEDDTRNDSGTEWLHGNGYLHPDDVRIRELARRIVGKETDSFLMLKRLNAYVSQNIRYGNPISGLYSDKQALGEPVVDCGGFASLYCSLAMSLKIPSRIVSGFWAGYSINRMHAWAESLLPSGEWISVDPSVEHLRDRGATRKSGRFGFVGSDRVVLSRGCDVVLETGVGMLRTDILQNPIVLVEQGETSVRTVHYFTTQDA